MNLESLKHAYSAAKLFTEHHAPTIMVISGVVSMGAAVVTAGKQTLQIEEVLEPHVAQLEKIEHGKSLELANYGKESQRKDTVIVYSRAGFDLAKLYAVPGVLFIGGSALVFGGHRLMLQRNATLAIAFTGLQKAYQAYRANVQKEMGPEFDEAMLRGYSRKELIEEDGKISTVNVPTDDVSIDPYNRVFEQGESSEWINDLPVNRYFLENQRKMAQERLNAQGHLYLSDVYHALGFSETPISRLVGWKITRNPDGTKVYPQIDFGLNKPLSDDWSYSREKAIYLDFNCQGLIIGGALQRMLEEA